MCISWAGQPANPGAGPSISGTSFILVRSLIFNPRVGQFASAKILDVNASPSRYAAPIRPRWTFWTTALRTRASMRDDSRALRRRVLLIARFARTGGAACCRRSTPNADKEVAWERRWLQDARKVVAMRALLRPVRYFAPLIAILVAMLAAGGGLPGLMRVLSGTSSHVCTCASGGTHASCPVCNPASRDQHRSSRPQAEGAPCGGRDVAVATSSEPGALPVRFRGLVVAAVRLRIPWPVLADLENLVVEPATPPPRASRS
jgi:hypothetical protein